MKMKKNNIQFMERTWFVYVFSMAITLLTLWLRLQFEGEYATRPWLILFMLPIILSAFLGGLWAGILATFIAALGMAYYLTPPFFSFQIEQSHDLLQLWIFIISGTLISVLNEYLHRSQKRVEQFADARRRTEESLRQSEERSRHTLDSMLEGCQILDFNWRYLYLNQSAELHNRRPNAELLGRNYMEMWPGIESTGMFNALKRCMEERIPSKMQTEFRYPDGVILWFELGIQPIPEGIFILSVDITESKQVQDALKENEEKYRDLVENSQNLICTHDLEGNLLSVNEAAVVLSGYPREILLKMNLKDALSPSGERRFTDYINEITTHGQASGILKVRIANGELRTWAYDNTLRQEGVASPIVRGSARDITERQQAEEALQASEMRFRSLIEHGLDNISLVAADGTLLWESPAAVRLLGYQYEQFKGLNIFALLHPDDLERVQKKFTEVISKPGNSVHDSFRLKHSDDTWLWVEAIGTNLLHEPSVSAVVINYRDITERKESEEKLRTSEETYRYLFANHPHPMWIYDLKTLAFLEVNDAAIAKYGYSRPEFLQMTIKDIRPAEQLSLLVENLAQPRQTLEYSEGWHHRLKNGSVIDVSITSHTIQFGGRDAALVTAQDITERKQSEAALQESQRRYQALFEDSPVSIWEEDFSQVKKYLDALKQQGVTDFRAYFASHPAAVVECSRLIRILDVNTAALKMYASPSKEELIHDTLQAISSSELGHNHEDFIAIAEGRTSNSWDSADETFAGEPLEISLSWSVVPGYEDDFSKVIVTTVDITERKQAEELIRQYAGELELRVQERTAELLHASRAKDEFLANMSHELRTPLNGILGFSETLLEGIRGPLSERQHQAVEIISSSGQHLLGLINDILDVSKIESGKFELHPETLVVNDICHSSLNFIKQLASKKSITVDYFTSPASPTLEADPKRLKQILVNLLNNAVKFTPEKGYIKLEVQANAEAGLMRFSVTDTGIGITPEDQQKIFNPFVQVDSSLSRQYEGTGLGLTLVKKLVEMHNGYIELQSEPNKGSCFSFVLPWRQKIQEQEKQDPIHTEGKENAANMVAKPVHAKILLVEDNEATVLVIEDYLENLGYEVLVADDGREIQSKAEQFLPHIILMDIQMPNVNGFEATLRLRADPRFATVPIIALTAFAMSSDRERCLEAGMNEYLSKPVKLKELRQMIEGFLERPVGE